MKLQLLASAALMLLSAVPGVFSEESSSGVIAKPVQMAGVLDAVTDEVDLFGEEFDAENSKISTAKKSNRSKKSNRNRSKRNRSKRNRSRRNRSRRNRRRNSHRRNMCGRNMRSRDRRTCDSLERQFCRSSRDRRRNDRICRDLGFRTLAEGAPEGSVETYAADSEVFSEDTMEMVDRIVDDVEDDLADYEDSADEDSADEDSADISEDEAMGLFQELDEFAVVDEEGEEEVNKKKSKKSKKSKKKKSKKSKKSKKTADEEMVDDVEDEVVDDEDSENVDVDWNNRNSRNSQRRPFDSRNPAINWDRRNRSQGWDRRNARNRAANRREYRNDRSWRGRNNRGWTDDGWPGSEDEENIEVATE